MFFIRNVHKSRRRLDSLRYLRAIFFIRGVHKSVGIAPFWMGRGERRTIAGAGDRVVVGLWP